MKSVLDLSDDDVALLLAMGPSAHHPSGPHATAPSSSDAAASPAATARQSVTVDVMIHVLRRRDIDTAS
ncbi:hypothetical protein [Clavibacter michiganensis]|uniref:hypothetical protein n=1 Tax=Clavibacter michiganensis TaxID=28447 RepID=UPI001F3AE0D5|nr:hypothetical protein [Clavibacter michiganensis]